MYLLLPSLPFQSAWCLLPGKSPSVSDFTTSLFQVWPVMAPHSPLNPILTHQISFQVLPRPNPKALIQTQTLLSETSAPHRLFASHPCQIFFDDLTARPLARHWGMSEQFSFTCTVTRASQSIFHPLPLDFPRASSKQLPL